MKSAWILLKRTVVLLLAAGIVVGAAMVVEQVYGGEQPMPPQQEMEFVAETASGDVSNPDGSLVAASEADLTTDAGEDARPAPPDGAEGHAPPSQGRAWQEMGITVVKVLGVVLLIAGTEWLHMRRKWLTGKLRPQAQVPAGQ